jgi:hypothetical protein
VRDLQLLSLVDAIVSGVRSLRNEQVRGSIPRGDSTSRLVKQSQAESCARSREITYSARSG